MGFSHVTGTQLPPSACAHRPEIAGRPWEAMGVSLVLHPRNPYVPTVHMNVRFFVAGDVWWFGGGMDLTPYYPFEEDCVHFHRANRDALATLPGPARALQEGVRRVFLPQAPQRAARHRRHVLRRLQRARLRQELRGDARGGRRVPARVRADRRQAPRHTPYGERERDFQAYRRGRYVEFNLVWDRGTLFGLQSGGRAESILMSLPPLVKWRYDWKPEPGSPEAKLAGVLTPPRDWANMSP